MRLEKRKNVKRGIGFGLLNKAAAVLLPFIIQTITIHALGIEYAGIKGLFTSVLSVLSLTELGIGTAIVYSMYRPIAEDNPVLIGALLSLYKKLYRIVGTIILALGMLLLPFIDYLITGEYPREINIHYIFLLYLANTVISYWMYAYKSSILSAYQRIDVISIIGTFVNIVLCLTQAGYLWYFKDFYGFLWISIIFTIAQNILISWIVDRIYPEIKCQGTVPKEILIEIKEKVAGLIVGKVCGTTRNTFDIIFISMFMGLFQATVYSNYYYIMAALNSVIGVILTALIAGVGNSIVLDSKESNYSQMMKLDAVYMLVGAWMTVYLLCLYQPFMTLWMGERLLFPEHIMLLFPIYFYVGKMGDIRGVYSDAAGLFWENRYRVLAETIANIVLNYLLVKILGAFGIMLATIFTIVFIGFCGGTFVIFRHYYEWGVWKYLKKQLFYMILTVIVSSITYLVCNVVSTDSVIAELMVRCIICSTLTPLLIGLMSFWNDEIRNSCIWVYGILRKH